jgi:hypothetical protein
MSLDLTDTANAQWQHLGLVGKLVEGFGPAGQRSSEDTDPVFGMEATLHKFAIDVDETAAPHVSQWQRACEEVEMMAVYAHTEHHCETLYIDQESLMNHMTGLWPQGLQLWQEEGLKAHARFIASGFDPQTRARAKRCRSCGKSNIKPAGHSSTRCADEAQPSQQSSEYLCALCANRVAWHTSQMQHAAPDSTAQICSQLLVKVEQMERRQTERDHGLEALRKEVQDLHQALAPLLRLHTPPPPPPLPPQPERQAERKRERELAPQPEPHSGLPQPELAETKPSTALQAEGLALPERQSNP